MEELVSVVIPVFNGEKYVRQAIESVTSQTYGNLEIIIVNDGSNDRTRDILDIERYKDSRIRIFEQVNQGSAAARNLGVSMARGCFIALLDADDMMLVNRLEIQMNFLREHPEVDALSCLAYYVNDKNDVIGRNYSDLHNPDVARQYIKSNKIIFCLQSGIVIKRSVLDALGGYRNDLRYGQDTELWNRLVERGFSLMVLPDILVRYRIHPDSSMTHFKRRFEYADWLTGNISLRRRGLPELTFQEFRDERRSLHWPKRMKLEIDNRAVHFYRTAGLMYGEKRHFAFVFYLVASLFMKPLYTIRKLYRQRFEKMHFTEE